MARKKKFELNDNNLAIAYYRFSSHSQNEASIDQQRELAHAWADAHGFKIVKEYEDAAISGTTEDRPGFQQMLSEVAKIRPRVLIMWKTDRLGRDKYVLAMAKRTIRDAGCEIRLLAENIPTDGPEGVLIEGLMDAMAEYYSRQLSQNIQRGMDYNAQHALYNGHKLFGYGVDKSTKRYIVDPDTAPFVQRMFAEYAEGKAMQTICDELNAQGLRTTRGAKFGVKTMNKMLQNRAYIGEYRHGDIVVEGGMPALVDEETFDKVQRKFAENKRKGSQRARGMDENDAPRYWLTGKVYCGKCGSTLQGVSGTSGTGRTYYYYYCSAQRRKQCTLKKVRKEKLEDAVTMILRSILHDSENLMSLAVDAAAYYEKNYRDTGYLDGLEAKRREVEKSLANLVKVIESGLISETVTERLVQLEEQKRALNEAIEAENIRAALCEDEHTIKAYFEKFLHADFDNPETRDQVLEYFVDKIYLTDDGLVVTSWYSEDRTEVTWDMLYGEDGNPFVKGEAVKFDCFPFGSTSGKLPLPRRAPHVVGCVVFCARAFSIHFSLVGRSLDAIGVPGSAFSFALPPAFIAGIFLSTLPRRQAAAPKTRTSFLWGARFFLPAFTAGVSFVTPAKPQRNSRSGHGLSAAPRVFSPCRKGPGKAKGASGASRAGSPPSPFCQPIPFSRFSSKTRFRAAAPSWGSRWNGARHRPTSYPSMATAALITVPEPPY